MRKAASFAALAAIAFASAVLTATLVSPKDGAGAAGPAAAPAAELVPAPFRLELERSADAAKPHPRRPVPSAQPLAPPSQRPRTTASLYERTIAPAILREQGCRAGRARTSGLVILDFGKPASRRGDYGTILFSNGFASNTSITWALKSYARGYSTCLPRRSTARIILVRGTSNFRPTVPSTRTAGRLWARETIALAGWLRLHRFDEHVQSAAGDDAEPDWDRTFRRTYDFFRGYRSAAHGSLLYNYGSLDGGPGKIWNVRQAYYVAAGMRYARAVPEIYNHEMARQWASLSRLSVERYGRPVEFAGLITQRCRRCGFTAAEAHQALVGELARAPGTRVRALAAVTNIGTPAP